MHLQDRMDAPVLSGPVSRFVVELKLQLPALL